MHPSRFHATVTALAALVFFLRAGHGRAVVCAAVLGLRVVRQ